MFNSILETGKYEGPDDLDDLEAGVILCAEYALRAINAGASTKRIDLLRDWITEAAATLKKRKQAQQPAPQPPASPITAAQGDAAPPASGEPVAQ